MQKPNPEISANARPARVAFVIEDGDNVHYYLNSAFRESLGRDGGRQSLIVPVQDGRVSEAYLQWLKIFDPDYVFLATNDRAAILEQFEQRVSPLAIYPIDRHPTEPLHPHGCFGLQEAALTALSWLPFLKVVSGGVRPRPEAILDSYPRWTDDGLVTDNFGTLSASFSRFPMRELFDLVRPLMLTPADAPADRWRFNVSGDEINSGYDFLDRVVNRTPIVTLGQLANLAPKHVYIASHEWARSFSLIVGDTFVDRVTCWNAGLLHDNAQQQSYYTLRVPGSAIDSDAAIEKIRMFLSRVNWITNHGNVPQVTVRSASISDERLARFAVALRTGAHFNCGARQIASIDEVCPTAAAPPARPLFGRVPTTEVHVQLRHDREEIATPEPFHLQYSPVAHPSLFQGHWICDVAVDRRMDNSKFSNVRDTWELPPRHQLAHLFVQTGDVRITQRGRLALTAKIGTSSLEITDPGEEEFFHRLLHVSPSYPYSDVRHEREPKCYYRYSQPSDKGRYLAGVLGMFGSLRRAFEVIGHGFWNRQLLRLANPGRGALPEIIHTLKKRYRSRGGRLSIEDDDQWATLAQEIVKMAPRVRQPIHSITLQELVAEWMSELTRVIERDPQLQRQRDDLLARAPRDLAKSLRGLCSEGVFHQGYKWVCQKCAYTNWAGLEELERDLQCRVCHFPRSLPVDITFHFRLNEFLARCIREQDTASVIWVLGAIQDDHDVRSLVFAPQTDLFINYPNSRDAREDAEVDLLCVLNGRVVVGEIKRSLADIGGAEIAQLAEIAPRLGADVACIGALEGDGPTLERKLAELRQRMPRQIEVMGKLRGEDRLTYFLP